METAYDKKTMSNEECLGKMGSTPAEGEVAASEPDLIAEKKVTRKLDRHIIPWVMLLYLVSFLDKVNIGNARLDNLEADLGMVGNNYQVAASILFVTYVTCEIPCNLLLKKLEPSRFIAGLAFCWGLIATLSGLCQNYGSLLACRLLLGAFESGLFPGLTVYLTMFYTKHELALRVGFLFVSSALAGATGGLLAYAIGFMNGVAGMHAWRWIFILEGLPACVLGIIVFFTLANDPERARYLTTEERNILIEKRNRQPGFSHSGLQLHRKDVMKCLTDWKIWVMCLSHFGGDTLLYGYSTFLPTIIQALGKWTAPEVQALTIPCYFVGAISYLIIAMFSDRQQRRALWAVIACGICAIGYVLMIAPLPIGAHYFGCILIATGLYVVVGIPMSWLPTNCPRFGKRTTASALQMTIGNCGGILAPFLYLSTDAPRYVMGQSVTLGLICWAGVGYTFMGFVYSRINKNRDQGKDQARFDGMSEVELAELGDDSPRYRYTV